jgi:glycosyltransferase involved in cell wall biosynthesis
MGDEILNQQILVAIPAYNEEKTIKTVVDCVRQYMSDVDIIVVNDGSRDQTAQILETMNVIHIRHACNLGYGRALQTALKYAHTYGYEALMTLDADGQHDAAFLPEMADYFNRGEIDMLIGSRYVLQHSYGDVPLGRRLGMQFFSALTGLLTGRRIFDTTSGLKIIRRNVFKELIKWHFIDFHAETIVYLLRLGYHVAEYPIKVKEREYGQSMYSILSHLTYPVQTLLMVLLGIIEAEMVRRGRL